MVDSFAKVFEGVEAVQWLWPSWLPAGQVSALIAEPGTGKSALALWLAGCAARALPAGEALVWPDGQAILASPRRAVLWCEAESRWAGHKTRCDELRLPIENLYSAVPLDRPFRLDSQTDLQALDAACASLHPALVVIDSLAAAHSHARSENDSSMHKLILPLQALAVKHNCAVLIIHHLRKDDKQAPRQEISLDDMRGSTAIAAVVVSVLALDRPDKSDKENRRLSHVKSNFSLLQPAVGFRWTADQFVFGAAPQAQAALAASEIAKQAEAEALLQVVVSKTWMSASDAIELCLRAKKTLNEKVIRRAFSQLRNKGLADMCAQGKPGDPPRIMWRLL